MNGGNEMYLIGKIYQSVKYRLKNFTNPLHNMLLMITIPNLKIDKTCSISKVFWGAHEGKVIIKKNTSISKWVCIMPYGGYIEIGENCSINSFCHINGNGGLKIGNNVRIAANCVIIPANHNYENPNIPITFQEETQKGIVIEDDVWIGAGVSILDGVVIGKGSVIGAGSVVNKSISPMSIAVGVPAKVVKKRC